MTDLSPILPRLTKLVPRLASQEDGEIVATVRAIDRTLRASGLDWHDFTLALQHARPGPRPQPSHTEQEAGPTWSVYELMDAASWCSRKGRRKLGNEERAFVDEMLFGLVNRRRFTRKQASRLMDIYARLGGPQ